MPRLKYFISSFFYVFQAVVSSDLGSHYRFTDNYWPPINSGASDDEIISRAVDQLHRITGSADLSECLSCKQRLQVGKFVALIKPYLIPEIYTTWCLDSGFDQNQCHMNFGYPSIEYSSTGADFAKVLSLMNPEGLDGDYFCYHHDKSCHVLPETPEIDLESLWPPQPLDYRPPRSSGETFNVLHFSDVNIQLDYTLHGESNCSQSICCAPYSVNCNEPLLDYYYLVSKNGEDFGDSFYKSTYKSGSFEKGQFVGMPVESSGRHLWQPAHEFGSYSCGSPILLLNSTFQTISFFHENHLSFEFALFNGGVVPSRDRILLDKDTVIESLRQTYDLLHHYFKGFPIFPTIGTKDGFPTNQLPQKKLVETSSAYQWLIDLQTDLWQKFGWLDLDSARQLRYSLIGYSFVTSRGLKIISLNSNVWNTKNLYNFWDVTNVDSYGIWNFLISELLESETCNQRVWITAHLPTSSHSLAIPSKVFSKIVSRFSPKVIAAVFFGHAGKEGFQVLYKDREGKSVEDVIGFALTAPSVSPHGGMNPAWKFYAVDSNSFEIVNSYTYYTPLNETFFNNGAEPVWDYGHSAREIFDPEQQWPVERNLDPEFWHHVGEKIRDWTNMTLLYNELEYQHSPYFDSEAFVGEYLEQLTSDTYCKVTSFTISERKQCMVTEDQDSYVEPRELTDYVVILKPDQEPEYQEIEEWGPELEELETEGPYDSEDGEQEEGGTNYKFGENSELRVNKRAPL